MNSRQLVITVLALSVGLVTRLSASDIILHNFAGGASDGKFPQSSLVSDGSMFYGVTQMGGASNLGIVFRMNFDGTGFTNLHSFTGGLADGSTPYGSLVLSGSTLYGTTTGNGPGGGGQGIIFKIDTSGAGYSIVHAFSNVTSSGRVPVGPLTIAGTTIYGTTQQGGTVDDGTIFRVNIDGTSFTQLHSFNSLNHDAAFPRSGLTLLDGTLYGMTPNGGTNGAGTIFKINTNGTGYSVIHEFPSSVDGRNPGGGLTVVGTNLYGMTGVGGTSNQMGTIFRINTNGSGFQVVYNFQGSAGGATGVTNDGARPQGTLLLTNGVLYGTTREGGTKIQAAGSVFEISPDGSGFSLLNSFGGGTDGVNPQGDLTLIGGMLYGMTPLGGTFNDGVIFAVPVPEPSAGALLLSAAAALGAWRARNRARSSAVCPSELGREWN